MCRGACSVHAQLKMLIRVLLGIIKNQISFNMRQTKENRKLFLRLLYIIILSQCVIIIAFAAHQYHLSLQPYNTTENSMEQEMFEKIIELERNFTAIPDSLLKIVIQPLILYDSNKMRPPKLNMEWKRQTRYGKFSNCGKLKMQVGRGYKEYQIFRIALYWRGNSVQETCKRKGSQVSFITSGHSLPELIFRIVLSILGNDDHTKKRHGV